MTLSKKKKTGVTIKGKKAGNGQSTGKDRQEKVCLQGEGKESTVRQKATNNSDKKDHAGKCRIHGSTNRVSKCVSKYHTTANEGAGQNHAPAG